MQLRVRAMGMGIGLALCAAGVWRASTAPSWPDGSPLPPPQWVNAFQYVESDEPGMRDRALLDFPADAWSQDDHLASSMSSRVNDYAARAGVSRTDVWRAVDEGLHQHWAVPGGIVPRATIVPCRPRPIY